MDTFARTQELSLAEQFDAGIRAFDLRPSGTLINEPDFISQIVTVLFNFEKNRLSNDEIATPDRLIIPVGNTICSVIQP